MANADVGAVEGPISVGSISALSQPDIAKSIAGIYAKALFANVKAYPYLVK